jgi:uncharacterized protein (DUF1778 family)
MTLSGIRAIIVWKWIRREARMPTVAARSETRTEKLDLRLTKSAKRILHIAAQAEHRSVSDFVLESALARAAEALPDRQRFGLDAKQWKAFQAALDAPPRPAARMARLLNEPSVFEKGRA